MEWGCHGKLQSVLPPITVPAWMCLATSQDPGSLGVYGFRSRKDHSYDGLQIANARSFPQLAIWDQIAREGSPSCVVGVPPGFPPRRIFGTWVVCFLTPDTPQGGYTQPASVADEIARVVGDYPVGVRGFRTEDKAWLRDRIYEMTRAHFAAVRHLMRSRPWEYFQFVEIGLDPMHHGFWNYHAPRHRQYVPGTPYEETIRDYYCYLDEEIGSLLALLDEDTAVLVVSYRLARDGLLGNTLVVITSDHGDAFGEHGRILHGDSLYRATTHVPLILRFPGHAPAGCHVRQIVGLVDVPTTILDLLGISNTVFPGQPLSSYWRNPSAIAPPVVSELAAPVRSTEPCPPYGKEAVRAVWDGGLQYLKTTKGGEEEVYDFLNDPEDRRNLSDVPAYRAQVRRLRKLCDELTTRPREMPRSTLR